MKLLGTILSLSIIGSVLLHLGVGVSLYLVSNENAEIIKPKTTEISYLSPEELKQFTNKKNKQIVEQMEKSVNDEAPKKDAFLSKNNQSVLEETKAKKSGQFNNENGQNGEPKKVAKSKPKKTNNSKVISAKDSFKPKFNWKPEAEQQKRNFAKAGSPSATDDHLKDLQYGADTLLNTREFIYYSYYQRIKKQLRQYWEPSIKHKMERIFKSGRRLASVQTRTTRCLIILNQFGKLVKVQVIEDSGVSDLDDAAVEAFEAAAPFPNPPKGIIEKDGTIKIRWDFVLEA